LTLALLTNTVELSLCNQKEEPLQTPAVPLILAAAAAFLIVILAVAQIPR
jgi:hypothetical protein